jgi:DNA modification methylase
MEPQQMQIFDYIDTDPQELVPPEAPPIVKQGELWQLGDHRLMCGDSTDRKVIDKLLRGEEPDLVFTDPPYGMGKQKDGVENDNQKLAGLLDFNRKWVQIAFDVLKPTGSFYCWGTDEPLMDIYSELIKPLIRQQRATFRNLITWDKGAGQGQRSENTRQYAVADEKCLFIMCGKQGGENNADSYSEAWEPVRLYIVGELDKLGVKSGSQYEAIHGSTNKSQHHLSRSHFALMVREDYERLQAYARDKGVEAFTRSYDDLAAEYESTRAYFDNVHDNMNNVWRFGRTTPQERLLTGGHPTPKPLALCERAIKSSSRQGEIVLDFFGGSGSTLIAAEELRRRCYVCELVPHWCDVIIRRWETITGKQAQKIE